MKSEHTKQIVGTKDLAKAVIERLGKKPKHLVPVDYETHETRGRKDVAAPSFEVKQEPLLPIPRKTFDGVDIFVDYDPATGRDPARLAAILQKAAGSNLKLKMISNRGVVVWPNGHPDTFHADHWRCRFVKVNDTVQASPSITDLMHSLSHHGLEVIKTENLYSYNGSEGYSVGQGQ